MNGKKLISLSHREIIGFDDEYISVNITKFKKYFYCLLASIGYILTGFYVGWSSKLLLLHDQSKKFENLTRDEISWIVSVFPLAIVIASLFLNKLYYWFGSKVLMLMASFSMMLSWSLPIFYVDHDFYILLTSRIIGGFGSGIIINLVPVYMKEIGGFIFNTFIVDLLISQFGLGIFIQYLLDSIPSLYLSIISVILSLLYFIICFLIPEPPHYKYYCDMSRKQTRDIENDENVRNVRNEEDLQKKSFTDLFVELQKLNLSSLIGLIMIEQLIGGISILFYIKYFAQLTGGALSTEWISKTVGLSLIISIPIAKLTKFSSIRSTKKQITISSIIIIICMTALSLLCIVEGITGYKVTHDLRHFTPLPIFAVVTFFHVAGITRNLWLIVQQIFSSLSLQLHLRILCTTLSWLVIFGITKVLPKLLYLVGVGYFYAYSVIFMIISLIYIQKLVPCSLSVDNDKSLHLSNSLSTSSCVSQSKSEHSSCNEIQKL